jgi:intracellular sulfur oxidation DsrE/DsrF family protein
MRLIMHFIKAVFHVDELDKWPLLLANVRNLVKVTDITYCRVSKLKDGVSF